MACRVDHSAFSRDTNGSQGVVARDHAAGKVRCPKRLYRGRRSRLKLVLEDNEAEEAKARLSLFTEPQKNN